MSTNAGAWLRGELGGCDDFVSLPAQRELPQRHMYLETNRMVLRNFSAEDLNDFHEIFGDAETMKHLEPPYSKKAAKKFLLNFCIKRKPKPAFAAVLKETGKVIGYVLFKSVDEPEIYEIAWIFNKSYWRCGYAYEICNRLISHGGHVLHP